MNVRLRFFASLREVVGAGEMAFVLKDGSTVSDLWEALCAEHPELRRFGGSVSFAVNREYAERCRQLAERDEVALIPPVSGGVSAAG